MNEIDISEKVKRAIKFGLPALLLLSVAVASIVWYALYGTGDLVVRDARVSSSMVGARVRVAGTVSEVLVKDGDAVKAGDVIARIKVNVTEEQLKQLQQTVELTQKNLDQLKQGIICKCDPFHRTDKLESPVYKGNHHRTIYCKSAAFLAENNNTKYKQKCVYYKHIGTGCDVKGKQIM